MNRNTKTRQPQRAFTLIEVLLVVCLIVLLISMLLPALGKTKEITRRSACQVHLHELHNVVVTYSLNNVQRLPDLHNASGIWGDNGSTAPYWFSANARDHMLDNYGLDRNFVYCPSNQTNWNRDDFWDWPGGKSSVWGYFYFGAAPNWYGPSGGYVFPGSPTSPYFASTIMSKPFYNVLWADLNRQCCGFEGDGWFGPDRQGMNHSDGALPSGSNEVFFDGHSEWVPWRDMQVRMSSGSNRYHW